MTSHEMKHLKEMLDDEDLVEEIGSEILQQAIIAAAEEEMNIRPKNPSVERTVREGEEVPPELRGTVPMTAERLADSEWNESWTDVIVWNKTWGEQADQRVFGMDRGIDLTELSPARRRAYMNRLSSEEQDILRDLDLMGDFR